MSPEDGPALAPAAQLEAAQRRLAELEAQLKKVCETFIELEIALAECRRALWAKV